MIWTRHEGRHGVVAARYEAAGTRVLVVENGYLNKEPFNRQDYAIALGDHNGAGRWYVGEHSKRWHLLGIELKPWRDRPADGGHLVICEQRGIGSALMASPQNWHGLAMRRLGEGWRCILREHTGLKPPARPLEDDLRGAWCVVTWSSSVACRAIILGVPVCFEAPHHVVESALNRGFGTLEPDGTPALGGRVLALERMAWAMWTPTEIAAGAPFEFLLHRMGENDA